MMRKLGDLCQFLNGGTPSKSVPRYFEGDIPWITSADIYGPVVNTARSYITEEALTNSSTNKVPKGTILLVTRTGVGKVSTAGFDLCFSQDITAIKPNLSKLDSRYLVHFLRTKRSHFERLARGATIKGITREVVTSLDIPLPSLSDQKRIANILDETDVIRSKRLESVELMSGLAQSIFLEMFGEPVSNTKEWKRVAFGELLDKIESGWSPSCLDRAAREDEWGVLKLGAVTKCTFIDSENKALPALVKPVPELEVRAGDLLFTRKNTYQLVAACALVHETRPRLMIPDLIFRLRLRQDAGLDECYLHQLLIHPNKRAQIQKLASGSAGSMPNISKARLSTVDIEVPPLELQKQFRKRIVAVEQLVMKQRDGMNELNSLLSSLQYRAFKGEL